MMCRNITCSSNLHGIDVKETEETLIFFCFLELHFFFQPPAMHLTIETCTKM